MKKPAIFGVFVIGILFAAYAQIVLSTYIENYIDDLSRPDDYTFDFEETEGTWELLWEKQNRYLGRYIGTRNQFAATMNTLCYVAPEEDRLFRQANLICVDIHDGKQKWIGRADSNSTLANDEKQVYVGGFNQHIRAYNAETGQEIWHKWINAKGIGRVTAHNGFVGVDGSSSTFDIFDASNGSLQSRDSVPIMTYHSFANDGNIRFEEFW
jgi:outer membrane protein assembly factor BamB